MPERTHVIFFVADQAASREFWTSVLDVAPRLDVPGMTELLLPGGATLGLMPRAGIRRLLGPELPDPAGAGGARCELYLVVDGPSTFHERALGAGAKELSPLQPRDWGDRAAYSLDPDGHVVAFAEEIDL